MRNPGQGDDPPPGVTPSDLLHLSCDDDLLPGCVLDLTDRLQEGAILASQEGGQIGEAQLPALTA